MTVAILSDSDKAKRDFNNKLLFMTAVGGGTALIAADSVHAQATTIDVSTVSAQTTAATTAISAVGVTLLAMAFGLLVFSVATNVIRRVMGG